MKIKIFTVLFIVMSVCAFALEPEHLLFKGVPIDGKLDKYTSQMEEKGFKHIGTEDNVSVLTGNFAGYKDCHIGILALENEDLVWRVWVDFPGLDTRKTLSGNYFFLKKSLQTKYGEPSNVVETFDNLLADNDQSKMYRIRFDGCNYYSTWAVPTGAIQLSIEHNGSRCFVRLIYSDKVNANISEKQAIDDL